VQAIVEAHKGKIEVTSEIDKGTIFDLYFLSIKNDDL
jgi:signal transduction histidine kinase